MQDLKELSKEGKRKDQWKDRRTGGEGRIKGRIDAQGVKGIWHDISNFTEFMSIHMESILAQVDISTSCDTIQ